MTENRALFCIRRRAIQPPPKSQRRARLLSKNQWTSFFLGKLLGIRFDFSLVFSMQLATHPLSA